MNSYAARLSIKHLFMFASLSVFFIASADALSYGSSASQSSYTAESEQAVFFIGPKNNATVGQEFSVKMGVTGMEIKPAGDMTPNTGHHHLLIDADPIKTGEVIPNSPKHLHFGKGQTETTLTLPPGKHILTLQFADGAHQSYGFPMRQSITVHVE
ncbi:MAG: DUF4399 domain-containing protein [Nitrosomonas sp.]|nr:DUF4399 domain-containing protein [Nitrosomonas sp.]